MQKGPKGVDKPQFSGLSTPTAMSLWCPPKRPGAENDVPLETQSRTTVPGCEKVRLFGHQIKFTEIGRAHV